MNSYYDLLKDNIIEFDKLILDKYYLLGLNETDTIILIKLNNLLKQGERSLSLNEIVPFMSISEDECSKRIVKLVEDGFVTLELLDVKSKEIFSLDQTYRRLSALLLDEDKSKESDEKKELVKETVTLLEKEMNKILSPIEREIISKWYYEYQYSSKDIEDAIMEALRRKNCGIQFIDRTLYKKNHKVEEKTGNSEIEDLFKQVYVRKKR